MVEVVALEAVVAVEGISVEEEAALAVVVEEEEETSVEAEAAALEEVSKIFYP